MIPAGFDYHAPATLSEAVALLSRYGEGAKVLSGGQSLLPLLKLRLGHAEHLVDIGRIPGLEYVKEEGGMLRIGGRTRESALEQSELVRAPPRSRPARSSSRDGRWRDLHARGCRPLSHGCAPGDRR